MSTHYYLVVDPAAENRQWVVGSQVEYTPDQLLDALSGVDLVNYPDSLEEATGDAEVGGLWVVGEIEAVVVRRGPA